METTKRKARDDFDISQPLSKKTLTEKSYELAIERLQKDVSMYRLLTARLLRKGCTQRIKSNSLEARKIKQPCLLDKDVQEFVKDYVGKKGISLPESPNMDARTPGLQPPSPPMPSRKLNPRTKRFSFNEAVERALKVVEETRCCEIPKHFDWPCCAKCSEPIDGPIPGVLLNCGHVLCLDCLYHCHSWPFKDMLVAKCSMCDSMLIECFVLEDLLE